MSKKKRKSKSAVGLDWQAIWDELANTNDRAAAIVGEAILDQSLLVLLSNYLVSNKKEVSYLLNHPGPLWSLYGKSNLAYCLGLITQGQLDDLRAIIVIRNHFAHKLHGASFGDQSIKQPMSRIEPYRRFLSSKQADSPRLQFNVAISVLSYSLSDESSRVEHRQEKKARSIARLSTELMSAIQRELSAPAEEL